MKVALVAPSPVPFTRGGAERAVAGLARAVDELTPHDAEVVKVPVDERTLPGVVAGYRAFADLPVGHFDLVVSMKYPAWMVDHPHHRVLMFHPLRGLYDTYHVFGEPLGEAPATREVGELRTFMADWGDRPALPEFFDRFEATVAFLGADHPDLRFPGPFAREVVHWLDAVALAPGAVERHFALSRTVAERPGYFPRGVRPGVIHLPGDLAPAVGEPGPRAGFFTASRLDGPKRLHLLVDAMAHVPGDVTLRIAGTGPEADHLRARAAHDPRIELAGFVSDEELEAGYAGALAVPFVPEDEDLGLVTLEAFSQATPVVTCTDSGGPTELVADGVTGLVVPPDPVALGRALARLAADPEAAAEMGRAGQRRGARVTWRAAVAALLGDGGRPGRVDGDAAAARTAHHAGTIAPGGGGARRRAARTRRPLVVVTTTFPIHETRHGGQLRCRHLYGALAEEVDVEVLALVDRGQPGGWTELGPGFRQLTVPRSARHAEAGDRRTAQVGAEVTDVVAGTEIGWTPAYVEALADAGRRADALLLAEPYLFPAVLRADLRLPMVYDAFNVEAELKAEALPDTPAGREVVREVVAVERAAVTESAAVTACSEPDAAALAHRYGRSLASFTVVPNGTDIPAEVVTPDERRRRGERWRERYRVAGPGGRQPRHLAVFFGSWHPPNLDAVELLADVAADLPEVLFLSVGSHGWAFAGRIVPPNLVFPGTVTDRVKGALLSAADVAVNPMRSGSGTNLKLVEYLAHGVPVVSTTFGARGVDVRHGEHLLLAPPEEFARGVAEVLADPTAAARRAEAGRRVAAEGYAWQALGHRLAGVVRSVLPATGGPAAAPDLTVRGSRR